MDIIEEIVTAEQWHEAEAAYSMAADGLQKAYYALRGVDYQMARDVDNALDDCKACLEDLADKSPVTICEDDFDRVASQLSEYSDEEYVSYAVRTPNGAKYTLIAEQDFDCGWTIWLEDSRGKGHHILDRVQELCELADAKWAQADYT